ncbi:hypothetical protein JP0092_00640 [Helicobacter pylori]|nr:hypothetical protein JP0092_00640 [Helicobacter pylori]GHR24089.1 hypothetical protein JP0094_00670 [Helicobacter pylori]GHR95024.1 hypothetical protein JP0111_06580 [Helicobacter pylori]GHS46835.1 hypothetical protein JP0126_02290 [Helicobacter pylori]
MTFKIAISYNKIIKKVTLKRSTLESGVQFYDKEEKWNARLQNGW